MAVDTVKYLDFVAGVTSPASSDLPQLLSRMTELDVTDDAEPKNISDENKDSENKD